MYIKPQSYEVYLHYKEDKEYVIIDTRTVFAEDNEGDYLIRYTDGVGMYARRPSDFFALVPHPETNELVTRFRKKPII